MTNDLPLPAKDVSHTETPADGTYRVLATLYRSGESYRSFAELFVSGRDAYLRFDRFVGHSDGERGKARKVQINVASPQLRPVRGQLRGVEYILVCPVHVDEVAAKDAFGFYAPAAA